MSAIYIIGTDTGVGKTIISGAILNIAKEFLTASYWKAVQTGTCEDDDTLYLKKKITNITFFEPAYRFCDPLSPHLAAKKDNTEINKLYLWQRFCQIKDSSRLLVIEGAGGVMVPLSDSFLQIDWIKEIDVPVIIVVHDKLGAINHTLLTVEGLRNRNIKILGIVLNKSTDNFGNLETISKFTGLNIVGSIPCLNENKIATCSEYLKDWVRELCKNF